jgi:hypothetical protein
VAILLPAASESAIPLSRGSTPSLKARRISLGDAATVPPSDGVAFSRCACACASVAIGANARAKDAESKVRLTGSLLWGRARPSLGRTPIGCGYAGSVPAGRSITGAERSDRAVGTPLRLLFATRPGHRNRSEPAGRDRLAFIERFAWPASATGLGANGHIHGEENGRFSSPLGANAVSFEQAAGLRPLEHAGRRPRRRPDAPPSRPSARFQRAVFP